ncbi:MAG: RNA 3'-terminal phosphate cyclase, partial [Candidatus Hodarchaeales archaeon]
PGLRMQHLIGLRALAELCGGELKGDSLGSESIEFYPSESWKSYLKIQIPTAGSIGLILQSLQLGILGVKNHALKVEFEGGATFGKWAPSIPYIDEITWNILRQMNFHLKLAVKRHGFFPRGGAKVLAELKSPTKLEGRIFNTFQKPENVVIQSFASNHLRKACVAERQSEKVVEKLQGTNIEISVNNEYVDSDNPGSGVLIYSRLDNGSRIGGDYVGERKLSAEKVGLRAFERYQDTIQKKCLIDPFLADQILPIMALASNSSIFTTPSVSNHLTTNINLMKEILDTKIDVKKQDSGYQISVDI